MLYGVTVSHVFHLSNPSSHLCPRFSGQTLVWLLEPLCWTFWGAFVHGRGPPLMVGMSCNVRCAERPALWVYGPP